MYRSIFHELGSALRLNGANYAYLLQFSGKTLGLVGAAITLIDAIACSTVCAGSAVTYLLGEFTNFPLSFAAFTVLLLIALALVTLFSIGESKNVFVTCACAIISCYYHIMVVDYFYGKL